MTSPSPASVEPISAADREKFDRLKTEAMQSAELRMKSLDVLALIDAIDEGARAVANWSRIYAQLSHENQGLLGRLSKESELANQTLRARVVELEAALAHREKMGSALLKDALRAEARAEASEARATALLEALRPFAEVHDVMERNGYYKPSFDVLARTDGKFIGALGDINENTLRAARAAINAGASNDCK